MTKRSLYQFGDITEFQLNEEESQKFRAVDEGGFELCTIAFTLHEGGMCEIEILHEGVCKVRETIPSL